MIDFRAHDLHEHSTQPADGPLEFTPEQTPDEARAWLAMQRYEREQGERERVGRT